MAEASQRHAWVHPAKARYYQVHLDRDLFGDWTLRKVWGGIDSSRGRMHNTGIPSYDDGVEQIREIAIRQSSDTGATAFILISSAIDRQKKRNKATVDESNKVPISAKIIDLVSEEEKQNVLEVMDAARNATSQNLGIEFSHIRANIFALDEESNMIMLKELTRNMEREEEWTITMPVGYGRCATRLPRQLRRDWLPRKTGCTLHPAPNQAACDVMP